MEGIIPPSSHHTEPRKVDGIVDKERHLIECFLKEINRYRTVFSLCEKSPATTWVCCAWYQPLLSLR